MNDFTELYPYASLTAGAVAAALTSLLKTNLNDTYPDKRKRRIDAALSGCAALSLLWITWRLWPEMFDPFDAIPYGIAAAYVGVGQCFVALGKKVGLDFKGKIKNDNNKPDSEN